MKKTNLGNINKLKGYIKICALNKPKSRLHVYMASNDEDLWFIDIFEHDKLGNISYIYTIIKKDLETLKDFYKGTGFVELKD